MLIYSIDNMIPIYLPALPLYCPPPFLLLLFPPCSSLSFASRGEHSKVKEYLIWYPLRLEAKAILEIDTNGQTISGNRSNHAY